jgi:hypothetical protein
MLQTRMKSPLPKKRWGNGKSLIPTLVPGGARLCPSQTQFSRVNPCAKLCPLPNLGHNHPNLFSSQFIHPDKFSRAHFDVMHCTTDRKCSISMKVRCTWFGRAAQVQKFIKCADSHSIDYAHVVMPSNVVHERVPI